MYIKEIASSVYAWDAADEGINKILDNLQSLCGVTSVYLLGIQHHEKRPLTELFYTHNTRRKYFVPENSHLYYRPDMSAFYDLRLKPLVGIKEPIKDRDWLDLLTTEARKRKLKTGCELSHTVFDTQLALSEYPDIIQKDIDGNQVKEYQMPLICPNNPDVHDYMVTLFKDVVSTHDIDFLQTAFLGFSAGTERPLPRAPWFAEDYMNRNRDDISSMLAMSRGGCFCEHCKNKAIRKGYDWDRITCDIRQLRKISDATPYVNQEYLMDNNLLLLSDISETGLLNEFPGLKMFIDFRMECMTDLFRDVYDSVHSVRPIELRFNVCIKHPEYNGYSFTKIAPYVDSVRDSDYSEQMGTPFNPRIKKSSLMSIRKGIGFDKPLFASIPIRPNATPAIIKESLHMLKTTGVDGISIAHYDNARIEHMRAFGEGIKEEDYIVI